MPDLERYRRLGDLAFRLLFSLIFVVAGIGHFVEKQALLERLESAPLGHLAAWVGPPGLLMSLTGAVLLAGGVALLLGFRARLAAAALILAVIPITITVHVGNPGHAGPLLKNVALLGGLIHFAARGAGPLAVGGGGD